MSYDPEPEEGEEVIEFPHIKLKLSNTNFNIEVIVPAVELGEAKEVAKELLGEALRAVKR